MLWPWKFGLIDECVSSMYSDRESYLTDQMPLQTLEYKVSLFCQNIYFNDIIWWWNNIKLVNKLQRIYKVWVVQIVEKTLSRASMIKDTYVWYGVMIECNWIIFTLVQVGDWRKYALCPRKNNKEFICIFHLVHNKFNIVL
jgi:hypothetical protein